MTDVKATPENSICDTFSFDPLPTRRRATILPPPPQRRP